MRFARPWINTEAHPETLRTDLFPELKLLLFELRDRDPGARGHVYMPIDLHDNVTEDPAYKLRLVYKQL